MGDSDGGRFGPVLVPSRTCAAPSGYVPLPIWQRTMAGLRYVVGLKDQVGRSGLSRVMSIISAKAVPRADHLHGEIYMCLGQGKTWRLSGPCAPPED